MLLLFEVTGKAEGTVDAVEFYDAALDKMCSTQERTHTSPYAFITHYITLFLSFSLAHTHTHTHTHTHIHTHTQLLCLCLRSVTKVGMLSQEDQLNYLVVCLYLSSL